MNANKRNEEFWLAQMGMYETLDVVGVAQEEITSLKRLISMGLTRHTVLENRRPLYGKWTDCYDRHS